MRPLAGAISVLVLCAVIVCVASSETHDPPNGNMSLDCRIQPEDQHSKVPDAHALLQMPQLASSRQTTSALDDVVHVQPRDDLAPVIMLQQHKPFRPHFCRPLSEGIPELKLWHLFVGTIAMVVFVFKALMQPMKAPRPTDSWTGIRALVAQWVVVEHLGIFIPPCGGGLFCSFERGLACTGGHFFAKCRPVLYLVWKARFPHSTSLLGVLDPCACVLGRRANHAKSVDHDHRSVVSS